ncbi:MAG: dihydropteroate synthase [Nitrososphaerales archaeon]
MRQPSEDGKISGVIGGIKVGDPFPVRIMGVVNLTKNSFYADSVRQGREEVIGSALQMEQAGADIIDVGARSTAPYRKYDVPREIEARLVSDAVKWLNGKINIPISVDTTKIEAAEAGIAEGASILNDVYGLAQKDGPELARIVSKADCSLVLVSHEIRRRSGAPMNRVLSALERSIDTAKKSEVDPRKIAVDPGIGFFSDKNISNVEWNCTVISDLVDLRRFRLPICVGVSRKKFIGIIGGNVPAEKRLSGSLAATAIAVYNGCHIVRTHDVAETVNAVRVAKEIRARQKRLSHNPRESET